MLVAGGANLTIRDRAGNTARELALAAEDRELAAYLHSEYIYDIYGLALIVPPLMHFS